MLLRREWLESGEIALVLGVVCVGPFCVPLAVIITCTAEARSCHEVWNGRMLILLEALCSIAIAACHRYLGVLCKILSDRPQSLWCRTAPVSGLVAPPTPWLSHVLLRSGVPGSTWVENADPVGSVRIGRFRLELEQHSGRILSGFHR